MKKKEVIKKLEKFKNLITKWQQCSCDSSEISTLRAEINKNKGFIHNILVQTNTNKKMTISPPPAIGGYVMENIDPLDIIFDAPYDIDVTHIIKDLVEEAIGVVENSDNFLFVEKVDKESLSQPLKKEMQLKPNDELIEKNMILQKLLKERMVNENLSRWQRNAFYLMPFLCLIICYFILLFTCKNWSYNYPYQFLQWADTLPNNIQKDIITSLLYSPALALIPIIRYMWQRLGNSEQRIRKRKECEDEFEEKYC